MFNEQTSPNKSKNFRLNTSVLAMIQTKYCSVKCHKTMFASGSSFMSSLTCRLHQKVTSVNWL